MGPEYRIRGIIYLILAIFIVVMGPVVLILGSLMGGPVHLKYLAVCIVQIIIAIILVIKYKRLFRFKTGEVLKVSKFENISLTLLVIILCALSW